MGAEVYENGCKGCEISQGFEEPLGGIIELDGNWILNHYGGEEGFLGWMALQPRFHRMELTDLNTDEAAALGGNIQNIDIALHQYWSIRFETDLIQRVYVIYFFESVYDKPKPTEYHLHIHLIPRTKKFDQWLRKEDGTTIIAWNIYKLSSECPDFPQEYRTKKKNEKDNQELMNLMTYLRDYLR